MKNLTKKQCAVINALFDPGGDESAVLNQHNISAALLNKWLSSPEFQQGLNDKMNYSITRSKVLLAKYVPLAAAKLVELCASDKEETARKACLDILALEANSAQKLNRRSDEMAADEPTEIPEALAAKLLKVLAEDRI